MPDAPKRAEEVANNKKERNKNFCTAHISTPRMLTALGVLYPNV
jgi:hypothetical protein